MTHPPRLTPSALLAVAVLAALPASAARAQTLHVGPYVQDVTPRSAWILWETTDGEESRVEWGPTDALGETASGSAIPSDGTHRIHEVELTGLSPATRYHYRVHTGAAQSEAFHFTTAPAREDDVTFRLVAMSDMQIDRANPEVYGDVIRDGILALLADEGNAAPDDGLAFALVPGDLVDDGDVYDEWRTDFFEPGAGLMEVVPFYPVLGNHEHDSANYYRYFHLPAPEAPGVDVEASRDRFWSMDWANVRVIGLDSNQGLLAGSQEVFFEARLEDGCADEAVDFVFVAVHHAHRSELWPVGEQRLVTQVVERMNRFTEECGKPSVHFYGHTHGYSRGASRDAAHLWVNVASAGGNLDYWGEYTQRDYEDVSVSQDEYGFVLVEVTGGADPRFHLRRYGRGDELEPADNVLRDEIVIRRFNAPPARPSPTMPRGRVALTCDTMLADVFDDPDGDAHGASEWQVSSSCDDFDAPILARHRAFENWYDGVDTQAGDDLTDEPLEGLEPGRTYCWRVRYRDRGLAWSEWSAPVAFLLDPEGATSCDDPSPLPTPSRDAGPTPADSGAGCGCRVGAAPTAPRWLLPLVAIGLGLGRRRRVHRPR